MRTVCDADVIVVGAGPVGLWLAAELRRSGVEVLVLERLDAPSPHTKAMTILPRSLELFAMRGLAERVLGAGRPMPTSHFALMENRLDFTVLDTAFPFVLFLPQPRLESILRDHAGELGVTVAGGHTVTAVRQDDDAVAVECATSDGPRTFRAPWVVGCDGPSSTVRKSAGIAFTGTGSTMCGGIGDVWLAEPPSAPALTVNRPGGALFVAPIGDGRHRIAVIDRSAMVRDADEPLTLEELRASVVRVAGTDFGMHDPGYLTTVGNAVLQAETYRRGRVLLAGDAAHIHVPLGGQGMNLGLGDAGNLGWRLAAVSRGASPDLLDGYVAERHPTGERVVADTRAQSALVLDGSPDGEALRSRFNDFLADHPSLNRELTERLSGLTVGYPAGPRDHPLVGQRVPDLGLTDTGPMAAGSVFELLRRVQFVLFDLASGRIVDELGAAAAGVATVRGSGADTADREGWAGTHAVLVRPDGYVGWAASADVPCDAARFVAAVAGAAQLRAR